MIQYSSQQWGAYFTKEAARFSNQKPTGKIRIPEGLTHFVKNQPELGKGEIAQLFRMIYFMPNAPIKPALFSLAIKQIEPVLAKLEEKELYMVLKGVEEGQGLKKREIQGKIAELPLDLKKVSPKLLVALVSGIGDGPNKQVVPALLQAVENRLNDFDGKNLIGLMRAFFLTKVEVPASLGEKIQKSFLKLSVPTSAFAQASVWLSESEVSLTPNWVEKAGTILDKQDVKIWDKIDILFALKDSSSDQAQKVIEEGKKTTHLYFETRVRLNSLITFQR